MIATVTLNPSLDEWIELPVLRLGVLNRASALRRYPGGKGINVSRVIHELGGATVAYALTGGDDGAILQRLLDEEDIRCAFVPVRGLTRNNYKISTRRPRALTEINTAGPQVSSTSLHALSRRLLRSRPRCVALSGSLPPGAAPTIYARWIRALRRAGIPSALDATGDALRHGLSVRPWLIKPNRQEAEEVLRHRVRGLRDAIQAAKALLASGPSPVILSLGADGALLAMSRPRGVWVAQPPRVTEPSSVGAVDSLVGGFLTGWVRGQPLTEAFRWGVACGTATAMTPGTALCRRAHVRRLVGRIVLRQVA